MVNPGNLILEHSISLNGYFPHTGDKEKRTVLA